MIKTGLSVVVSVGVGAIVNNAVKSTTPVTTKGLTKLCVVVGTFVLGSMFSEKATKYTDEKIDEAVNQVKVVVEEAGI